MLDRLYTQRVEMRTYSSCFLIYYVRKVILIIVTLNKYPRKSIINSIFSSDKCIIVQSFDNIFKKNRSKSTKTSLFSKILITFAYSCAIKAGQILV